MATHGTTGVSTGLGTHGDILRELIRGFTDVELANVKLDVSLSELGLDSIAAIQLAHELLLRLHLQVHPDELFQISLNALTEHVHKSLSDSQALHVTTLDSVNVSLPVLTSQTADNPTTVPSSIIQIISKVTGIPVKDISEKSTLRELGIDSFSLLEIKQLLEHSGFKQATLNRLELSCTLHDLATQLVTSLPIESQRTADTERAATQCLAIEPHSFNPFEILAESDSVYEAAAHRSGFAGYWGSTSSFQNDLLLSYVNEAFIALGVDLSKQPCGVEIPTIPCIPKYDRLMKRLLDFLQSRYIVNQQGGKVLRGSDPIDVDTSPHLCEQLRIKHPAFQCEVELMNLIGPRLAECLSGKLDPLSVLFGSVAARQIMDNFYRHAPMMAAHTEQLVSFFVNLAQGMAKSSQMPIRILEVGAGTGGTTEPLVTGLENAKVPMSYTFTDVGASFVHKARARWGRHQWMNFLIIDIEEEIPEAFHERYDIVIGANVVHATRDRTATCRRLREALRPGGVLVLSELTRPIEWYDICFGLLDGWWLADGYAIQPPPVWMDAFKKAGFQSMGHSSGNSEEANTQQLLIAYNKN
ncbi:S-adenosyl-L-methionine-dependent methyltransferase [Xylaria sp. FL1042]|nr:S-adenosyl-L-methionine-dependent methyltransferase [Xylaria sp. FL1042]